MPDSLKQFGLRIITGQDHSPFASVMRGMLAIAEPFYSIAMTIRNACYDHGILITHDLGRPTISVGNITTGGTGKTPVVQWLADELRRRGHRPAILLRGYASAVTGSSDEAQLLDQSLNAEQETAIPVQANPSRLQGAADVLRDHPQVTHFILDDGFQHRRAKRDFNLVLVSATQPFGFDHVLPRGLLREPLSGLGRADAFLITRCSLATVEALARIESFLAGHHPTTPIFHCDHVQSGLLMPSMGSTIPMESLAGQKVFVVAGIGDPTALERQIAMSGCQIVGTKWFPDHHAFTSVEVNSILEEAKLKGAALLLTTEKDWVKMKGYTVSEAVPAIGVLKLQIEFRPGDARRLLTLALSRTTAPDAPPAATHPPA
jgi:tetraacyldisaccharide 4'-kinase